MDSCAGKKRNELRSSQQKTLTVPCCTTVHAASIRQLCHTDFFHTFALLKCTATVCPLFFGGMKLKLPVRSEYIMAGQISWYPLIHTHISCLVSVHSQQFRVKNEFILPSLTWFSPISPIFHETPNQCLMVIQTQIFWHSSWSLWCRRHSIEAFLHLQFWGRKIQKYNGISYGTETAYVCTPDALLHEMMVDTSGGGRWIDVFCQVASCGIIIL